MQFIRTDVNLDFIGKRKLAFVFSAVLILLSIGTLLYHGGPLYGIDFSGGTLIQVRFEKPVAIADIKAALNRLDFGQASVQQFGEEGATEYLIRTDLPGLT
ncbi:MAG TPA: protein translocase subunit SecF, partial [Desulfosarcina sp.]|nr:protein translocase subunit SecF [Desulfosarcina sp.]